MDKFNTYTVQKNVMQITFEKGKKKKKGAAADIGKLAWLSQLGHIILLLDISNLRENWLTLMLW